jgi:hypothetical protein
MAAMVPPKISIGAAGTGMPSWVTSTLINTAHTPREGGIATGKCHTTALLRRQ